MFLTSASTELEPVKPSCTFMILDEPVLVRVVALAAAVAVLVMVSGGGGGGTQ